MNTFLINVLHYSCDGTVEATMQKQELRNCNIHILYTASKFKPFLMENLDIH